MHTGSCKRARRLRANTQNLSGGILTAELANSRTALSGEFLTEACKNFRGLVFYNGLLRERGCLGSPEFTVWLRSDLGWFSGRWVGRGQQVTELNLDLENKTTNR